MRSILVACTVILAFLGANANAYVTLEDAARMGYKIKRSENAEDIKMTNEQYGQTKDSNTTQELNTPAASARDEESRKTTKSSFE